MKDRQEEERSVGSSDESPNKRSAKKRGKGRSRIEWDVDVIYNPEDEDKIAEQILVVLAELLSGRPVRYVRDGSKQKKTEGQAKGGQTGDKPRKRGGDSQDRSP